MAKLAVQEDATPETFWNETVGVRPREPVPGLYEAICHRTQHVYDLFYGPEECARCGAHPHLSRLIRRAILVRKIQKARRLGQRI